MFQSQKKKINKKKLIKKIASPKNSFLGFFYYVEFKEWKIYFNTIGCLFMLYTVIYDRILAVKHYIHCVNCIYIDSDPISEANYITAIQDVHSKFQTMYSATKSIVK